MISKELIEEITRIDRFRAGMHGPKPAQPPTQPVPATETLAAKPAAVATKSHPVGSKRHQIFAALRMTVAAKVNVFLVGPAGSGKTTVAKQVAHSLGLRFHFNGAIHSEYKLTGFRDAQGKVHRTAFREAFEHGGLYLFDEIDASQPAALLAFNAALANGMFDFPDRHVQAHPNFRCIAAANTWGKGVRSFCTRWAWTRELTETVAWITPGCASSRAALPSGLGTARVASTAITYCSGLFNACAAAWV